MHSRGFNKVATSVPHENFACTISSRQNHGLSGFLPIQTKHWWCGWRTIIVENTATRTSLLVRTLRAHRLAIYRREHRTYLPGLSACFENRFGRTATALCRLYSAAELACRSGLHLPRHTTIVCPVHVESLPTLVEPSFLMLRIATLRSMPRDLSIAASMTATFFHDSSPCIIRVRSVRFTVFYCSRRRPRRKRGEVARIHSVHTQQHREQTIRLMQLW